MNKSKSNFLTELLTNRFKIDRYDAIKILLMGFAYFCILASYSILRPLKTSIFLGLVGKEYQPLTRFISIVIMIPYMFFYSKMVDKLKRRHIVGVILGGYGVISILFAFAFSDPVHGLRNTMMGPYRILGWAFEIFMDLYSAVILSTFWSFVNSICTPSFANRYYGVIVGFGKAGGILSPLLGYGIISMMVDWKSTSLLTFLAGILLIIAITLVFSTIKSIPYEYTQGYEATIQQKPSTEKKSKPGMLEGLRLMLAEPYVFGVFWLMFSVEIISIIFDYQMQVLISSATNNNIALMSKFMMVYTASFQAVGFVFAFFGTATFLRYFGIRSCLMIMPIVIIGLIGVLAFHPTLTNVFIVMVIIRSLNYGFDFPLREMLYIPTVKDIQFKSKAWADSFGKTFSKTSGSAFNWFSITQKSGYSSCFYMNVFTLAITAVYLVTAFFVGRKYVSTVKNGKIIGGN